jgi:cytochrome c-type biogenesis protein CcmH
MANLRRRLAVILLLAILALAGASVAAAQGDGPTDDQVNAIAKELYCPVCENIPLDACGTQACVQWRELIRERLAQGWDEAQIKAYFVEQYGERVLATPPARGLNWLVYLAPPLVVGLAALILFRALRAWRKVEPEGTVLAADSAQVDPYVERLEEQLKARSENS